jgi:hypothetical protein
MALRQLKPYTVLITASGKSPITLTIRPVALMVGLSLAVGSPLAWISSLIYQNYRLAQRNETLTETATDVLTKLHTLDAEIEVLKDRAGLPETELILPKKKSPSPLRAVRRLRFPPKRCLTWQKKKCPIWQLP